MVIFVYLYVSIFDFSIISVTSDFAIGSMK